MINDYNLIRNVVRDFIHNNPTPNEQALEFFETLKGNHIKSSGSYFTFFLKSDEWSMPFSFSTKQSEIPKQLGLINNQDYDIYMTPNSFLKPDRKSENIFNINALYVDIDCHDDNIKVTKEMLTEVTDMLTKHFNVTIPEPTMIVFSGRGMHLYWKIDSAPSQLADYWSGMESNLLNKFSEILNGTPFEADERVKDVSRVLRVPGSYNSKSKSFCTIYMNTRKCYRLSDIYYKYFSRKITTTL